ncbi:MAG: ERAP1-like C-terminal domain-containing protein, partial [Myxococcales bacterium]|nr:ERAP1-like C-terminal domain-containing protein [Myxococcales bacterium]
MFERWIGVEVFREGIRAYMDKHRFGTATYEDLLGALGTAAERDVATPFSSFLFQPGVPFLETELQCDGAPVVRVSQSRYLPVGSTGESDRTWQVPVCVRYGTGKTEGKTHCELITETTAEIKLPETTCPGWISPNADGVGYYRFGLATKDWEALQSVAFSGLSGLERLAIVDSLQAAFWNGSAEAKDVLEGLGPIAKDPERRVAEEPMSLLGVASKHLVHAKALPAFEAFAARLYAPRAKELGWDAAAGESGDAKLERASVLSFLALTAKDPKVRKEAEKRGHAVVSAKGQSAEVVPAELVSTVLTVALQEGDMAFFDGVVELALSSEDTILRSNFLSAIGRVTAPDMAAKVRELVFDPRVRTNEIRLLVSSQSRASETRDAFWKWFVDNWDRYVERITKDAAGGTPYMAAGFCSESDAAAVEAFFKDRIDDLRGGPRNLAAVLEGIRICAAMVDKQAAGVTAFFEKK